MLLEERFTVGYQYMNVMARWPDNVFSSHIKQNMYINLFEAILNVKLKSYGFNSSLGLILIFKIEFAYKLEINLEQNFAKSEFALKKMYGSNPVKK